MEKEEKYSRGVKPTAKSEYFGKSYKELQSESKKVRKDESKAQKKVMEKMK